MRLPPIALTLAVALALQLWWWPLFTPDMTTFLLPWFKHILATGPVAAFAQPFSNYSPPYLYLLAVLSPLAGIAAPVTLIKLLSFAGGVALALAMRRLFAVLGVAEPARAAALMLLLPSVALNAGLMSQCDTLWSAACVMAVANAIERRHGVMLAWCGVAVAFKAQAVLGAPFFLALLIGRRVPFRLWPIALASAAAMMLPAWAAGWPAADLTTIYLRQAGHSDDLALNAPNLWAIVQAMPVFDGIAFTGVALAATLSAAIAYVVWFAGRLPSTAPALLQAALLAPLLMAGLLPRMHERYFFLADLLAFALATLLRDQTSWRIALLVQAGSLLALLAYLSGIAELAAIGAAPMIAATVLTIRQLVDFETRSEDRISAANT